MTTAIRSTLIAAILVLAASAAYADCITGSGTNKGRPPLKAFDRRSIAYAAAPAAAPAAPESDSVVGLWTVTFFVGNGPDLYDYAFEQFHADGTEFTNDVAVPPAAGNVCVGVWEKTGPRSIKLHHVGWNWDLSASPAALAGVFVLDMTVTVDPNGHGLSGHYVTDSYDLDGTVIPAFHGEGAVSGTRITPASTKW